MWQALQKDDGTWSVVDAAANVIAAGLTQEQASAIIVAHNDTRRQ